MHPAFRRPSVGCLVLLAAGTGCRGGAHSHSHADATDITVDLGDADTSVDIDAAADAIQTDAPPDRPDAAPLGLVAVISSLVPRSVYLQSLAATGRLTTKAMVPVPEFAQTFALSADGRFLYALGRTVAAFAVDATTASLTAINDSATGLSNWAGIAVDPSQRWLILSDNTSGLAVFALRPDGGIAQPPGTIVTGQVASDLTWDPSGRFLFALSCYGSVVTRYTFDARTGAMLAPSLVASPDAGPGRLVFHPSGKTAYMMNIKAQTVTSFTYDTQTGTLANDETASLVDAGAQPLFDVCYPGHLVVHPSGRFAYATTTQSGGTVAIMSIADSGRLSVVDRNAYFLFRGADALAIDPTGTFLLVGNTSGGIDTFAIDQNDGRLTYVTYGLGGAQSLAFLP